VVLHSKVADYVQNNRRRELADLERAYRIAVEIVGDPGVELSTERYEWFDVPAWEVPSVPDRGTGDADDDRSPAVPAAPSYGEQVETPPGDAAPPRPAQEQRDGDGGGKRGRRKRRRRGGRNRDGSAQEPSTRERGASPAASIGSVVKAAVEVNGNVAPEPETEPVDWEEAREAVVTPAVRGMSHETPVTTATEEMTHEAGDAPPSSRRRRRRRKRSRGEGPASEGPFEKREAPPVSQEVPAESTAIRRDEDREVTPVPAAPLQRAEQPSAAAAPTPSVVLAPEAGGEPDREAPAPREEAPVKKAPRKTAPKKAVATKKAPAKAAPKKTAARKGAAEKAPPKAGSKGRSARPTSS
jgi:ribonuclease E